MKNTILIFIFIFVQHLIGAQIKKEDIWSGSYSIYALNGKELTKVDTLTMEKTADAKVDDVAGKLECDLKRWIIRTKYKNKPDQKEVRRFLFDIEDDRNEYEEFGWTELHKKGKMNCIDGGNFFICQTTPKTTVKFSEEESFYTKTGFFGIWLHTGLAELKKLE